MINAMVEDGIKRGKVTLFNAAARRPILGIQDFCASVKHAIDGHAPSSVDHIEIDKTGLLSAVYQSGAKVDLYRIPLATVVSPDRLNSMDGNVYGTNSESGDMRIGAAQSGGFGTVMSSSLEQSTVDLGAELTNMIATQRAYTANTKVFQAAADLLDVINNFKV
jgi:flagellar hook protein FlgE